MEDVLQRLANEKEALCYLVAAIAEDCHILFEAGAGGEAASLLSTSKREVELLADWWSTFCDLPNAGLEPEAMIKVDLRWMRAIMDSPNPEEARELALQKQWSPLQIRRHYGTVVRTDAPRYCFSTSGYWLGLRDGLLRIRVDLGDEPPEIQPEQPVKINIEAEG